MVVHMENENEDENVIKNTTKKKQIYLNYINAYANPDHQISLTFQQFHLMGWCF